MRTVNFTSSVTTLSTIRRIFRTPCCSVTPFLFATHFFLVCI